MSRGRVYLDIMGAFTVLGELRMAMPNKWEAVDRILQAQGVRHKEAFRFELHLYYLIKIAYLEIRLGGFSIDWQILGGCI